MAAISENGIITATGAQSTVVYTAAADCCVELTVSSVVPGQTYIYVVKSNVYVYAKVLLDSSSTNKSNMSSKKMVMSAGDFLRLETDFASGEVHWAVDGVTT